MSAKATTTETTARDERGEANDGIDHDETFGLLSNHRRRYALHHLRQREERTDLGTLAEQIAAWENETSVRDVSATERKRVYTSLQQIHLPRMDEAGVVEFDDRAGTVELGPTAENLDFYLEVVEGRDVPWSQYYLGLAAVNVAVVAGGLLGGPLAFVSSGAAGAFAVTTLAISALVHAYYGRTEMHLGSGGDPPEVDR